MSCRLGQSSTMIFRICLTAGGVFLALSPSAAADRDELPLKRGIYVRQGMPCASASNADTLSYWGSDNGINDQQDACVIRSQVAQGSKHSLSQSCRNIRFKHDAYRRDITIDVRHATAFALQGDEYRYCRPLPQPIQKRSD